MFNAKIYCSVLTSMMLSGVVYAANSSAPATTHTYTVSNLQIAVSNSTQCQASYQLLQKLSLQPLSLQFNTQTGHTHFKAKDLTGKLLGTDYEIVHQTVTNGVINRLGTGAAEINNQIINYIVAISADSTQPNYDYSYPSILSSNNGHCYFFALIKPDTKTIAAFRQSIKSGSAAKSTDLSGH